MTLAELKHQLVQNPDLPVRFYIPNGQPNPAHAHVTEVALIDKKFIDCLAKEKCCARLRNKTSIQ